jgi:hypothetical protein
MFSLNAFAADLNAIDFRVLRVIPKSTDASFVSSVPDITDDGNRILDWMNKNGKVTELVAGTVPLHNGIGQFSTMRPIEITPDPSISIAPDKRRVGVELKVKGEVYDSKALIDVVFEYSEPTGKNSVLYTTENGHQVFSPITASYRTEPSGFLPIGYPFAEYSYQNGQFYVLVLTPQAK